MWRRGVVLTVLAACWAFPAGAAGRLPQPGDLVLGSRVEPPLVAAFDPGSGDRVWEQSCAACRSLIDVEVLGDGTILIGGEVAGEGAGTTAGIVAIDPATGAEWVLTRGNLLSSVRGLAVEADGAVLVTDSACPDCGEPGRVIRVDPATGSQELVSAGGPLTDPHGIAVGPEGTIFVVGRVLPPESAEVPGVVAIDPGTGEQRILSSADPVRTTLNHPVDLAVDAAGEVFVLDLRLVDPNGQDEGRIFSIDPADGSQTLLTGAVEGIDRRLENEVFLGLAISGEEIYAVDYAFASEFGGVNRFEAVTGAFPDVTAESALQSPGGLAVVDPVVGTIPGLEPGDGAVVPGWVGGLVLAAGVGGFVLWRLLRDRNPDPGPEPSPSGP